jgi:hypothetical protein
VRSVPAAPLWVLLALAAALTMSCGAADGTGSTATGASPGQAGDPACAPQDARFDGAFARSCCLEEARWRWNGADCEVFWVVEECYCSRCVGADCERLFESEQACHAAYAECPPT